MAVLDLIKRKQREYRARRSALDYVRHLRLDVGLPVTSAYMFGSMTKGKSHDGSDVDVAIISPYFDNDSVDELFYLWQNRRIEDVKNSIQPVGFTEGEFNGVSCTLVQEIRKGIRLA